MLILRRVCDFDRCFLWGTFYRDQSPAFLNSEVKERPAACGKDVRTRGGYVRCALKFLAIDSCAASFPPRFDGLLKDYLEGVMSR